EKDERLAQPRRRQLGDEDGDAERDRRRDEQREDRRVERAPDERQRAELPRHWIPHRRAPEAEAERTNRQPGVARQHERDRDDDDEDHRRERAGPQTKPEIAARSPVLRAHADRSYEVLTLASAAISSVTTASGSGA